LSASGMRVPATMTRGLGTMGDHHAAIAMKPGPSNADRRCSSFYDSL
jgi:hypothetical protein